MTGLKLLFLLALLTKSYLQKSCLLTDPDNPGYCIFCEFGYYSIASSESGENPPFDLFDCVSEQEPADLAILEVFISSSGCQDRENFPCDGSAEHPFGNLWDALKFANGKAEKKTSSRIAFYLIKGKNEQDGQFFLDRIGALTSKNFFFRRAYVDVSLKPLYCSERNIIGCFEKNDPPPVIYVRSESAYIFISKQLKIEDLIFDGSEVLLEDQGSYSITLPLARFCSDADIKEIYDPTEKSKKNSICSQNNRTSKSKQDKGYALLNLEPLLDFPSPSPTVPYLELKGCVFRYFFSSKEKGWGLRAIISVTSLYYNIQISTTVFQRLAFSDGILTSFRGNIPFTFLPFYPNVYKKALAEGKDSYKSKFIFNMTQSQVSEYNIFGIKYNSAEKAILNFYSIDHNIKIHNSLFTRTLIKDFFFFLHIYIPVDDFSIKSSLVLTDNFITGNSIFYLLVFEWDPLERFNEKFRYQVSLTSNFFQNNSAITLYFSQCDVFAQNNMIFDQIINYSFFYIITGKLLIEGNYFEGVEFLSNNKEPIIFFKGDSNYSSLEIMKNTNKAALAYEMGLLKNCYFSRFFCNIISTPKIIKYLEIVNCTFENGGIFEINSVIQGIVKDNVTITGSAFKNLKAGILLNIFYANNIFYSYNIFSNLSVSIIHISQIVQENIIANYTIKSLLVKECFVQESGFNFNFKKFSNKNLQVVFVYDTVFEKIFPDSDESYNRKILVLSILHFFELINSHFISNHMIICVYAESSGEIPQDFARNILVSDTTFRQEAASFGLNFMNCNNFLELDIKNSKFIFAGENNARSWFSTLLELVGFSERKLHISTSIFFGARAKTGGALFIKIKQFSNLLIESCLFIENKGFLLGGDLVILTTESLLEGLLQMKIFMNRRKTKIGIVNNKFLSSVGYSGAAISVFASSELFLYNNTFQNCSAFDGGVIYVEENCRLMVQENYFNNCFVSQKGGVIFSEVDSIILFVNAIITDTKAEFGGVFYLNKVQMTIENCTVDRFVSKFGAFIYATDSDLKCFATSLKRGKIFLTGSLYLVSSRIQLVHLNLEKCFGVDSAVFIYAESCFSFLIRSINIDEAVSEKAAIITISSNSLIYHYFEDIALKNFISQASFISATDAKIKIKNCTIFAANSLLPALNFESFKYNFFVSMVNLTFYSISINKTLLSFVNGAFSLEKVTIFKITALSSELNIMTFKGSKVNLEDVEFLSTFIPFPGVFIDIEDSNLILNNSRIFAPSLLGGISVISGKKIIIMNTQLQKAAKAGSELQKDKPSLSLKLSELLLENCTISGFFSKTGAAIYNEMSNLTVSASVFSFNQVLQDGGAVYFVKEDSSYNFSITFTDSYFLDNSVTNLRVENLHSLKINSCHFLQRQTDTKSQVLYLLEGSTLLISNTLIQGVLGLESPISVQNKDNFIIIDVDNINVKNCRCKGSGGVFNVAKLFDFTLTNSTFFNVSSEENGGVAQISCAQLSCSFLSDNNTFESVYASVYGLIYHSKDIEIDLGKSDKVKFAQEIKTKGALAFNRPSKILFLKFFPSNLEKFRISLMKREVLDEEIANEFFDVISGREIELVGLVLDSNNNFLFNENAGTVKLIPETVNSTTINDKTNVINGLVIFRNLVVNALPGESLNLTLKYENGPYSITQTSSFHLRTCIRGEIVSGITCQECPQGFFSLVTNPWAQKIDSCKKCPANFICPGRDILIPKQGYWRKDENQTIAIKCLKNYACPEGGMAKENFGKCGLGYEGNLCFSCFDGFAFDSTNSCINCSEDVLLYIKFAGLTFISLLLIVYQTEKAFNIDKNASKKRAMIKIMVDHMSYSSIIFTMKIEWISFVFDFYSFGDQYVNTVPKDMFNFDCFLSFFFHKETRMMVNSIIISFTPIFYSLTTLFLLLLFHLIMAKKKKKKLNLAKNFSAFKRVYQSEKIEFNRLETKNSERPQSDLTSKIAMGDKTANLTSKRELDTSFHENLKEKGPVSTKKIDLEPEQFEIKQELPGPSNLEQFSSNLESNALLLEPKASEVGPRPSIGVADDIKVRVEDASAKPEDTPHGLGNFRIICSIAIMLIIIFYNFYPRLMLNAVKLFKCVEVDDLRNTYVELFYLLPCWEKEHVLLVILLSISNILIWGVLTPYLLYLLTRKVLALKEKINDSDLIKLSQFITLDYKRKYYYWDLFSYTSKFLVIFLTVITNNLGPSSQGGVLIFFFLILLHIQETLKPFSSQMLNTLKSISYLTTILSIVFAIMSSTKGINEDQKLIWLSFAIFFAYIFYIFWGYHYLKRVKKQTKTTIKRLSISRKKK